MKKPKNIIITLVWLEANNACDEQVERFGKTFGMKATLTPALMLKHAPKFDFDWFLEHVLTSDQIETLDKIVYTTARAAHREVDDKFRAKYLNRKDGKYRKWPQWEAYEKAMAPHHKRYTNAMIKAQVKYLFSVKRRGSYRREHNHTAFGHQPAFVV